MQLQEFYDYKERFMYDILTDEKIVKMIDESVDIEDAKSLVYTKVFPYEYVPETIEKAATYICCDVDIAKNPANKTFYSPIMYVWIFTHKSLLRHPDGGSRVDRLCSAIAGKVNGSRFYGLGELELYAVSRFAPLSEHQGKCLTFKASDFNKLFDANKKTPANRKTDRFE